MGTVPPILTLLEIGDLSLDRFRGILRLGYQGDAWIEVRCRVQANPLSHNPNLLPSSTLPLSAPLLASQPLLVPMTLRLSKLHLRAILILVVSQSKGITLVFKNDPLQNVDVSSTFDSIEVIRGYLQQEIEGQLREMFREDLPGIIHRLSQRWFTGTGMGGRVELPYRDPDYAPTVRDDESDGDDSDVFSQKDIFPRPSITSSSVNVTPQKRPVQQRTSRRSLTSESPTSYTVFPGIEEYDPTYGLRPEGVPTHSGYEAFGRMWEKARSGEGRGFGALTMTSPPSRHFPASSSRGDVSDYDDADEETTTASFDMVEMDQALRSIPSGSRPRERRSTMGSSYAEEEEVEWETFPAVGGGVITRPRIYHSQSQIRAPSETGGTVMQSPSGTGSITARASSLASSTIGVSGTYSGNQFPEALMGVFAERPGKSTATSVVCPFESKVTSTVSTPLRYPVRRLQPSTSTPRRPFPCSSATTALPVIPFASVFHKSRTEEAVPTRCDPRKHVQIPLKTHPPCSSS